MIAGSASENMKNARQVLVFMTLHGDLMTAIIFPGTRPFARSAFYTSAIIPYMSCDWNAAICTHPQSLKEIGAPRQGSNSLRENRDCLEQPPRKAGSKWIVYLYNTPSRTQTMMMMLTKMGHRTNWLRQHSTCTSEAFSKHGMKTLTITTNTIPESGSL